MANNQSLEILSISGADAAHAGLALATARAGGCALLDLEHCRDESIALDNLRELTGSGAAKMAFGLRLLPEQLQMAQRLHAAVPGMIGTWLLAGDARTLAATAQSLPRIENDRLLVEIINAEAPAQLGFPHDGLVARGHEAGGWVGEDTSYILLQKLAPLTAQTPLFIQGGIGLHSTAACRAAGAAGVVLDDQLLLLPESPLSEALKNELARLNGAETQLLGELTETPCRVYARPGSAALQKAETNAHDLESGALDPAGWHKALQKQLGWRSDDLIPLGQGVGLAAHYRDRFRSVGRLFQAMRSASLKQIEDTDRLRPLAAEAPLAQSHGTRYPLAQGPMTRVSDNAVFAAAVARGGALPFLALALMRGKQVTQMLEETRAACATDDGELPWGVGMLGFVPHALRQEQCEAIWACKPPYALIAGGRPDQAAEFEQRGIKTYIHAPAPALLKLYLEQGAKRFVFEGRECGGHIGPLASFPLWEQMIEVLLTEVKAGDEQDIHLLFAGGVNDATSGAMLAALTAPLATRGFKVGALMGTAYLFTDEIVSSGAIVPGFQAEALSCRRTAQLKTGPGHSTRCAATTFADDFHDVRRRLLAEGKSAEELRDALEDLNLGRLRIASKGLTRNEAGDIVSVEESEQHRNGMYMIGQIATLRHAVQSIEALHRDVTETAQKRLHKLARQSARPVTRPRPADIAIVGIGTLLPKADDAGSYWENILDQLNAIREVPSSRWDWQLYFDADRNARDKIYSRWGGFLDELPFDPLAYGIPPRVMKQIDPLQLLTLEVVRRGLSDAGWSMSRKADDDFDRENTSIMLGTSGGLGDLGTQYAVRAEIPRFIDNPSSEVWDRLPEWSEESFAGSLLNVAAGRVANRMDLGGLNFTVDAACASSLAAISMAVNELESGRSNVAIAGGVDTVQSPFGYLCFSKTQALSPNGKARTFDKNADGIAISEGLAVVVMKRLADAERDGDRIYAVIKAMGGSSDGKALGMTAPRPEGQMRALKRAYRRAGFSPATLGLAEAHGTGTVVGDRAEARTITETLKFEKAQPRSTAIGSVKTLIGHTKASAGVAGLIKVALSLYHRTLPAHAGVETPIDAINEPSSPVYLLQKPRPWLAHPDHPRRGGVSAFGFGGTNFHGVLEEYRGLGAMPRNGAERWPWELVLLRAESESALLKELDQLQAALQQAPRLKLRDLAYSLALQAETRRNLPICLALVARDIVGLVADLKAAQAHLTDNKPLPQSLRLGRNLTGAAKSVGFLFPGQGAQYVNMGRETALYIDELRQSLELADRTLRDDFTTLLSQRILPPAAFDAETESAQAATLTDTQTAQPAIGAVALGYYRLARRLGLKAMASAGHSYGEYAALMAAGVLSAEQFLKLSAARGKAMAQASSHSAPGTMAAVQAPREVVAELIADLDGVRLANHNTPQQAVISGPVAGIEQALERCADKALRATRLPVSGAFHTALVAEAQQDLSTAIKAADFNPPRFAVYSNTTGTAYPQEPQSIREALDKHLLNSVEFVKEIESMYADGVRVFVELGPKSVCSNMVRQTLADKDVTAVSLDGSGGGMRGLLLGLAELCAAGVACTTLRLYDGRDVAPLDLKRLPEYGAEPSLPKHTWMISGGCARPIDDPVFRTGIKPPMNKAEVEAAALRSAQVHPQSSTPAPPPNTLSTTMPLAPDLPHPPTPSPALNVEALAAYQGTMRQFLSLQEKVMQQFLGAPGVASTAPSLTPPVQTQVSAPPTPASGSRDVQPASSEAPPVAEAPPAVSAHSPDLKATLLGIVAERTGYPEDMLAPDADLEADLGIDSIKRVEILGAFQKSLPAPAASAVQAAMERFTKARSLNAILDEARACLPQEPSTATATENPAAPESVAVDYTALLTDIVAERTGYPEDMLDHDADLEADLGIDSIKRVEILGAFQKALPATTAEAVQGSMERFTKARSLGAILEIVQQLAPASTSAPTDTATVAAQDARPDLDTHALLLGIVAERTGYPEDMLDHDADLEADLGIDSIKRVEILGAFQKALPATTAEAVQGSMEQFTKARSLADIIAQYKALSTGAAPKQPAQAAPEPVRPATAGDASQPLPRFVLKSQPTPLSGRTVQLTGAVLLMGGPNKILQLLGNELQSRGLTPVFIDATQAEDIAVAISEAQQQHGPATALLHLHGLDPASPDASTDVPANVGASDHYQREHSRESVFSLFHAARSLATSRPDELSGMRLLAATRLGGTLGRDAIGKGAALAGGVCGITNCLHQEYPDAVVRTVDFDGQRENDIAALLIDELFADDTQIEAGYVGHQRHTAATVASPLQDSAFAPHLQPSADWVVLVTGGARGITAEILDELATPGLRMILLGRTPEPLAEAPSTAQLDAAALRKTFIDAALGKGEKPRPVEIDRAIAKVMVDREIRGNLERLRTKGVEVEYRACDVRDAEAFGALIDDVYARHQRIDLVIHAAGVIEDKLLPEKTGESFARVFGTKIDPACVLAQHLKPDSLKAIAFFSSVAGRYGNRGQIDYAAGNEALNRLAWSLSRRWASTRVLSINWGPWDAGMASEAVRQAFRERGMQPIPVAAGRRYFAEELALGSRQEVEIVAGDGPWKHLTPAQPSDQPASATPPVAETYPLIRESMRMGPGGNMTLNHVFTLDSDPYLGDHCMDGKAVLPAAAAAEWMAQFVGAAWPGWHVVELHDLRQFNGVVLENGQRAVQLRARASSHSDSAGQTVSVEMIDPERKLPFYRAAARLLQSVPPAPVAQAVAALENARTLDAETVYNDILFHGKCFRLITGIEGLAANGIDASLASSTPDEFFSNPAGDDAWLFDPGLVDVPPQLALVWGRLQRDMGALPARFGAVLRYGEGPLRGPIRLLLRLKKPPHERAILYDAQFVDADGRLRLAIVDGESTMSAELNRLSPGQSGHIKGLQA